MARGSFRLPTIQELSKQQRNALDLPLEGQHLIVGGPGTGKSVVALLRADRLARARKDYLFLVYNVLLDENSYGLAGDALRAVRWKKWFRLSFPDWYGCPLPRVRQGDNEVEDWDKILAMEPRDDVDTSCHLVIDEGQDMPPQFYETLVKVGFEDFYVVADQNQRITDQCSSRQDIERALGLVPSDTVELTLNYRNTLPIARLAHHFYTDDPASPPVELPPAKEGERVPLLVQYEAGAKIDFDFVITSILMTYDRNVDKLVCVVTPNNALREKYIEALRTLTPSGRLDHERPEIQTYSSGGRTAKRLPAGTRAPFKCPLCDTAMMVRSSGGNQFWGHEDYKGCDYSRGIATVDFTNGGIVVINQQSIKGLEFDVVYIADIDQFQGKTVDELKKKFYVMTARARDLLYLVRTGEENAEVESILPPDCSTLKRRKTDGKE